MDDDKKEATPADGSKVLEIGEKLTTEELAVLVAQKVDDGSAVEVLGNLETEPQDIEEQVETAYKAAQFLVVEDDPSACQNIANALTKRRGTAVPEREAFEMKKDADGHTVCAVNGDSGVQVVMDSESELAILTEYANNNDNHTMVVIQDLEILTHKGGLSRPQMGLEAIYRTAQLFKNNPELVNSFKEKGKRIVVLINSTSISPRIYGEFEQTVEDTPIEISRVETKQIQNKQKCIDSVAKIFRNDITGEYDLERERIEGLQSVLQGLRDKATILENKFYGDGLSESEREEWEAYKKEIKKIKEEIGLSY